MSELNIGSLYIQIGADTKGFSDALVNVEKALNSLTSVIDKLNTTLSTSFQKAATSAKASAAAQTSAVKGVTQNVTASIAKQQDSILKAEQEVERLSKKWKDVADSSHSIAQVNKSLEVLKNRLGNGRVSQEHLTSSVALFNQSLKSANASMDPKITTGWQSKMQDLTKSVQLALGPLSGIASRITALTALFGSSTRSVALFFAGFTALTVGLHKSITAAIDYQKEMKQLEAQLTLTGNAAGRTLEQLNKMAKDLAINTLTSLQEARAAESALLSFTSVSGNMFDRALKVSMDLSTVLGGGLVDAAKKVGRALENPSIGLRTLTEAGIRFTKQEQSMLTQLVDTGKAAEAQDYIMRRLESTMKNVAAGAAGGVAGDLDTLGVKFQLLLEAVGKNIDVLPNLSKAIQDISSEFGRWADALNNGTASLSPLGKVVDLVASSIAGLVTNLDKVVSLIAGALFVNAFKKITLGLMGLVNGLKLAKDGFAALTVVMKSNIIGIVATAVASLAAYFLLQSDNTDKATESVGAFNSNLRTQTDLTQKHIEQIKELNKQELASKEASLANSQASLDGLAKQIGYYKSLQADGADYADTISTLQQHYNDGLRALNEQDQALQQFKQSIGDVGDAVSSSSSKMIKGILNITDAIETLSTKYDTSKKKAKDFSDEMGRIDAFLALGQKGFESYAMAMAHVNDLSKIGAEELKAYRVAYDELTTGATTAKVAMVNAAVATVNPVLALDQKIKGTKEQFDALKISGTAAANAVIANLQKQRSEASKTVTVAGYNVDMQGFASGLIKQQKALDETSQKVKVLQALIAKGFITDPGVMASANKALRDAVYNANSFANGIANSINPTLALKKQIEDIQALTDKNIDPVFKQAKLKELNRQLTLAQKTIAAAGYSPHMVAFQTSIEKVAVSAADAKDNLKLLEASKNKLPVEVYYQMRDSLMASANAGYALAQSLRSAIDPTISLNRQIEIFKQNMDPKSLRDKSILSEMQRQSANWSDILNKYGYDKTIDGFVNSARESVRSIQYAYKEYSLLPQIKEELKQYPAVYAQIEKGIRQTLANGGDETQKYILKLQDLTKSWTDGLTNAITDFVSTGKNSFKDLLTTIKTDIDRILVEKLITAPLKKYLDSSMGSGAGFWSMLGQTIFSANGNTFSHGHVTAFANGGAFTNSIVSSPTAFNMGVMGEKGPEAVVPLTRTSDGKLGIKSSGGGITVNVIVNGMRDSADIRRSAGQVAAQAATALSRAQRNL
jgi:hypothetical protein